MENKTPDDDQEIAPVDLGSLDQPQETAATGLAILAERVARLAEICAQLVRENRELREQTTALHIERDELREKNEQSRARIDAMLVRLKNLERTS